MECKTKEEILKKRLEGTKAFASYLPMIQGFIDDGKEEAFEITLEEIGDDTVYALLMGHIATFIKNINNFFVRYYREGGSDGIPYRTSIKVINATIRSQRKNNE